MLLPEKYHKQEVMLYANQPHYKTSQESQWAPGPPECAVRVQHELALGGTQLSHTDPTHHLKAQPSLSMLGKAGLLGTRNNDAQGHHTL